MRAEPPKIMIFALAAGIAGFGGVFLSLYSFNATNDTAPPIVGLFWLALAVTFGIRRPGGALLAGLRVRRRHRGVPLDRAPTSCPAATVNQLVTSVYFVPILSGLGAIQLAQEPDGILAYVGQRKLEKRRAKERLARIAVAEAEAHGGEVPVHERLHPSDPPAARLTVRPRPRPVGQHPLARRLVAGYGDVEVLHGVDLHIEREQGRGAARRERRREVDAVSRSPPGWWAPTLGTVTLQGVDVTATPAYQRARAGMLLVPEARGVFPGLSVEENLAVAARDPRSSAAGLRPVPDPCATPQAAGRTALRWRAADAEPRARPRRSAGGADRRRAHARTRAPGRRRGDARHRRAARPRVRPSYSSRSTRQNALTVADTVAFMELGVIVWSGPRAEADMEMLSAAYLGGSVGG